MYFPPPPSDALPQTQNLPRQLPAQSQMTVTNRVAPQQRTSVPSYNHPVKQPGTGQYLRPTSTARVQPRPQQLQPRPVNNQRALHPQQQAQRPLRPRAPASHPGARPPQPFPAGPAGEKAFTGPPAQQQKAPKMAKIKNFSKTPAGKIAMRVGTGIDCISDRRPHWRRGCGLWRQRRRGGRRWC